MLLTNLLLKQKAKSVMVLTESMVSGYKLIRIRERLADKLEFLAYDPYVDAEVLFKEVKKIHSMKGS